MAGNDILLNDHQWFAITSHDLPHNTENEMLSNSGNTHIYRICKWMFKLQYHMMCNSIPMNDTQWHAMVISYVVQYKLVEDAAEYNTISQ